MRLSVPAEGGLRAVVAELATKIAEYLGTVVPDPASLDGLAARVHCEPADGEITFEFTEVEREFVILARCNGRSSEVRYPLPS
jgi:hypothetical protein